MADTNALFDNLLAAYRKADDPDRFLREFLMRLDDATTNAVVATERKLDRLDAAKARLDAARQVPRPNTSDDGADTSADAEDDQEPDDVDDWEEDGDDEYEEEEDQPDVEQAEAQPEPNKRRAKTSGLRPNTRRERGREGARSAKTG
jgi:hypothetical protein